MKRSLLVAAVSAAACLSVASAYAGYKDALADDEVVLNLTTYTAWAGFGATRASKDTNEYAAVDNWYAKGDPDPLQGHVYLRDKTGAYAGCWTSDAGIIGAIRSAPSDAKLTVQWDHGTGECLYVQVFNGSYNAPKLN
jgi:hypothetical protein